MGSFAELLRDVEEEPDNVDLGPPPKKFRKDAGDASAGSEAFSKKTGVEGDQVRQALVKIAGHIGSIKKFPKAAALLRELMSGDQLTEGYGGLVFEALRVCMVDLERCADPALQRDYVKLFTLASKRHELFTAKERNQLDVLGLWAVTRNQLLHTDDSFVFNKVVSQLKAHMASLPECRPEEEQQLLEQWLGRAVEDEAQVREVDVGGGTEMGSGGGEELDPFGLGALMEDSKRKSAHTWSSSQCLVLRRQALLACLLGAKSRYKQAWARTSVDILVTHTIEQQRHKFTPSQVAELMEAEVFVRQGQAARKSGPSAKEQRRDVTSFEAARAEWAKAAVSARGKVGASGGDAATVAWLG